MSNIHRHDFVRCGHCGLWWDDAVATAWTPTPSGRCPFEYFHKPTWGYTRIPKDFAVKAFKRKPRP